MKIPIIALVFRNTQYPQYSLKTRSRSPVAFLSSISSSMLVTSKLVITHHIRYSCAFNQLSKAFCPPNFKHLKIWQIGMQFYFKSLIQVGITHIIKTFMIFCFAYLSSQISLPSSKAVVNGSSVSEKGSWSSSLAKKLSSEKTSFWAG